MIGDVLDSAGQPIPGIGVFYCRPRPVANVIESGTLGGSWHVQTVGETRWLADVMVRVIGLDKQTLLQDTWGDGASITVRFDGMAYTGIIRAEPRAEVRRRAPVDLRRMTVTFTLLIIHAEAVGS